MNSREASELFHLFFLRVLGASADRAHYRVKGGCNLRFWFKSVRYSEDLDLDVVVTSRPTLRNKVDRMLDAGPLVTLLRARGLMIEAWSAPKQTDTTQRWKVSLRTDAVRTPIQTKIEFSRRKEAGAHAYEPVDAELARRYAIPAPLASHYLAPTALAQKIRALAGRSEPQARDVFDLHLLLSTGARPDPSAVRGADLHAAISRAIDVSYDDFVGQVGAFLEPAHRVLYESREAWNQMQAEVVQHLEALA